MEWELSKENVQPLRKGRNVQILNQALKANNDCSIKSGLVEHRRKMLEDIDNYVGDDPLQPWLKCIEWVKEAYPSGGAQSGLLPLLELCARTFCSSDQYKSDLRYLNVWIEYANRCTDPKDIYVFLEVNNIGQTHALFYESYAAYLEHCKYYSRANDIYDLGLCRHAEPAERLQNSYRLFLQRTARNSKQFLDQDRTEKSMHDGQVRTFGSAIGPLQPRNGKLLSQSLHQNANNKSASKQKFSIFVDPKFKSGSKPTTAGNRSGMPEFISPIWKNLGSQAEMRKENIKQPSTWTTTKLNPQRTIATPMQTFEVFADEECTKKRPENNSQAQVSSALPLRLEHIQDMKRETDMLRQTPLRHFL
ncbi:hypothetical protein O6H91_19G017100 [Diphasiastrum complanatum]|uniref:Uncharacterized protein n=1 Tax=Diphasiastrum complanatum TaxID=34168 RepID=A0ACC2ATU8_DIPCM|nr:hypothetical protein O6H91_19G017100 [Diphasiastrum complanatum]